MNPKKLVLLAFINFLTLRFTAGFRLGVIKIKPCTTTTLFCV